MPVRRLLTALLFCCGYGAAQSPPPSLTTLYNFTGGSDGARPWGRLVIGSGGVLYGTTGSGGAYIHGTVFSLTPPPAPGGAWTESVLYSFQGPPADGSAPKGRLAIGSGGVLYGTTATGGAGYAGIVFALAPPTSPGGEWTETVLSNFQTKLNLYGGLPSPDLAIGPAGTLYGTTEYGGSGCGTVFALAPPTTPGGPWGQSVPTILAGGGCGPYSGVAIGNGGILYGATYFSRPNSAGGASGSGTVFSLSPPTSPGGAWTETVLYDFSTSESSGGPAGANGPVVIASGGVLYGTTEIGGSANAGTVYSLTPPASPGGAWTEAVVHDFPMVDNRYSYPGPLTLGEGNKLYGATSGETDGTILVLKPPTAPGGAWTEIRLYSFSGSDGHGPNGVTIGGDGVLYGTTSSGGTYDNGTVFALTE